MDRKKIQDLEAIISTMDIPFYRKIIKSKNSIRWLNKNLKIRNFQHKDYQLAEQLIKDLL